MSAAESESISISAHLEREPNLEQARRASAMAHQVVIKLKEMGLPDEMDGDLSKFCTDLGDLWSAQNALAKQVESFLKSRGDWNDVGDGIADLQATVEHLAWHAEGVRAPMQNLALWAYSRGEEIRERSEE